MTDTQEPHLQINHRWLENLNDQDQRYKLLLESLNEPVVELLGGRITYLNAAWSEHLGYSVEESLSRRFADFCFAEDDGPSGKKPNSPDSQATVREIVLLTRSGRKTCFRTHLNPHESENHQLGVLHNMGPRQTADQLTPRHAAQLKSIDRQLRRSAQLKDEFLATMSHELRTPLCAIIGFCQLLQEGIHGPLNHLQTEDVKMIADSGQHLLDLINNILDYTKLRAGNHQLQRKAIDLDDICQRILNSIRPAADRKNLRLVFTNHSDRARFAADPMRLRQILANLLDNAVKFTPKSGIITLSVRSDTAANRVVFNVRDTGIGIAPHLQNELFMPFTQQDGGLDRNHEGSGLGLSIVKELTELHGGSVTYDSVPAKGSTFTVSLPLYVSTEPTNSTNDPPHA